MEPLLGHGNVSINGQPVVVIGSGPSGAMAARALVARGIPVVMLESGDVRPSGALLRMMGRNFLRRVPPFEPGVRHVSSGDPHTDWFTTLKPGGLSNQWTGAVPRFIAEDFTEGERLHERYRWPVTYQELEPFYERVERVMAITASRAPVSNFAVGYSDSQHSLPDDWKGVAKVAETFGQGLTVLPLADGPPWMAVRRGTAFNSFANIVAALERSPLFQLITGAHALRLEYGADIGVVDAVIYQRRGDGSQHRVEGGAFVVACGPLHSTKLLFDSAAKECPDGLGNSEGNLGAYLHDHPKEWWMFDSDQPLTLLSPSAYLTRLPYATSEPLMATSWTLGVTSTKDKIRSRLAAKGHCVGVQVFGTMVPSRTYRVQPSPEKNDEFGLPALDVRLQFDPYVVDNMMNARLHMLAVMGAAGYNSTIAQVEPQLHPGASAHYGGTARMHHSKQHGVVDGFNRMFDAPNVIVCDASSFTTGVEKNPTLTAMALAVRAAEQLADDLKVR